MRSARPLGGAAVAASLAIAMAALPRAGGDDPPAPLHHVVVDTDFALPPQDDGLALAFVLNSPELDVVGITTVAGNFNVARANADALRMLEIAGREAISVYGGAPRPLVHTADAFARAHYGRWWSDEPPPVPPGGFAKKALERESAADFLGRIVLERPGAVEILALGPLTNLALALERRPAMARAVKRIVVMGGAIAALPDGAGNITPNAEFNFWVDPEAARAVLRSGIPIELSPLNVSRRTSFDRTSFERLVAAGTPLTALIDAQMRPRYARASYHPHMYDEVAAATLVDPTLVKTKQLVVDVDTSPGIDYGVSVGGPEPWPGAEGARTIDVQYDIDNARFMRLFVERVGRTVHP
jgi:inosine-uridine nucleoside N-ribohydrolase